MTPKVVMVVMVPTEAATAPKTSIVTLKYTSRCCHFLYRIVSITIVQKGLVEAMHCCRAVDNSARAMLVKPRSQEVKNTMRKSTGAISRVGLTPVFVDIDPVTYNMCPEHTAKMAEQCDDLRAIMPVHLYGQAADMDAFIELGERHGVPIIEDAAQAMGTKDSQGAMVGTRGTIGTWSFFPTKNLGGFGDGGMCTTHDDELAESMRMDRVHGMEPKYYHRQVGVNSRLDALQAAVLAVKLRHLESWHAKRKHNADVYTKAFAAAGAATTESPLSDGGFPLRTPHANPAPARHIYNQYIIRVPEHMRDDLRAHLTEHKIGTEIYYPVPLHMQECFADLGYAPEDLPESLLASKETIALPIYPDLSDEQLHHVATTIIEWVTAHAAVNA